MRKRSSTDRRGKPASQHTNTQRSMKLSIALTFFMAAITAGETSSKTKAPVELYTLNCGQLDCPDMTPFSDTGEYAGETGVMAMPCYLIHHDKEWMLWDAGLGIAWRRCLMARSSWVPCIRSRGPFPRGTRSQARGRALRGSFPSTLGPYRQHQPFPERYLPDFRERTCMGSYISYSRRCRAGSDCSANARCYKAFRRRRRRLRGRHCQVAYGTRTHPRASKSSRQPCEVGTSVAFR